MLATVGLQGYHVAMTTHHDPATPLEAPAEVVLDDSAPLPPSDESVGPPVDDVLDGEGAEQDDDDDDELDAAPDEAIVETQRDVIGAVTLPDLGDSQSSQLVTIERADGEILTLDKVTTSASQRDMLTAQFLVATDDEL